MFYLIICKNKFLIEIFELVKRDSIRMILKSSFSKVLELASLKVAFKKGNKF